MKKVAVYPGTFDPITKGHEDIILRAADMFDGLVIGVLNNYNKVNWFSADERVEFIKKIIPKTGKIEVRSFEGLLVDFMKEINANIVVRGLRALSDYEYELQLALTNWTLADSKIETIFLPAQREHLYLSSSVVKEVLLYGGNVHEFMNDKIVEDVKIRALKIKEEMK